MRWPNSMLSWTWRLLFAKPSKAPLASEKRPTRRISGNPQPGFWLEDWGIGLLIRLGVGHRDRGAVDQADAAAAPELRGGNPAFEAVGQMAGDGLDRFRVEALPGRGVGAGGSRCGR